MEIREFEDKIMDFCKNIAEGGLIYMQGWRRGCRRDVKCIETNNSNTGGWSSHSERWRLNALMAEILAKRRGVQR